MIVCRLLRGLGNTPRTPRGVERYALTPGYYRSRLRRENRPAPVADLIRETLLTYK
jgi:hypothetical protein